MDALNTYLPTMLRYVLVMFALGILMFAVYRVQLAMGVKHEAAAGRALVTPWVVGFLIFNVFTIGSSFYLSFTEYNLFKAPEWIGLENYRELFSLHFTTLESPEQRSTDVLPPRYDEVVRIGTPNGGFLFGAKEEEFWRAMKLTIPYAFLTVPIRTTSS